MSKPSAKPKQTPEAIAEQRIAGAISSGATVLSLSGLGLRTLPDSIGQLQNLQTLDLESNQLTALPEAIDQLQNLQLLELGDNHLTDLPEAIGQLLNLRELSLSGNHLTDLPEFVGQLQKLQRLGLGANQFTTLPESIVQLQNLEILALGHNELTALPESIGQITKLHTLFLWENQLTTLPEAIGQLQKLEMLSLWDNQLTALPEAIGKLKSLQTLLLHQNPLLGLPDSVLGPTLEELSNSERAVAARPQDILNFYFAQQQGAAANTLRRINEVKVMLVGRGEAGKTSLRRFFMGEPHNKKEGETPGIALETFIHKWEHGTMKVRLWDFAGQDIAHALHHFFLTDGCVYVLVLDPRSNTEMQDAEYWLAMLQRYAPDAPVLVALNRQDARQGGYDVDRRMLKDRFPVIQSYTETNCETRKGCDALRERLFEAVMNLKDTEPPHLWVPKSWLKVMKACDGDEENRPPHLTLEQFRGICAKHGEKDVSKQESLARMLHKLGTVLHFIDEPRLRDTTVLNPHWVTDGVYRLLRYKDKPGSDGTLTLREALEALPDEGENEARFFLRLMERFEMCFPIDEEKANEQPTKWLIPGALEKFQPEGIRVADWLKPGSVRMRYIYDPLPEGVLPRFIVMTHLLSEGNPRWRNGVVLKDGQALALVRRGEKSNHVEVTAYGPTAARLHLMEIVQGTLERIHIDLPEPKPIAELELAGLPGIFRRIADLEAAELGQQDVAIDTGEGKVLVEPAPQLDQTTERAARVEDRHPLKTFLSYSHLDRRAKTVFVSNLTVMAKKKLTTTWHDGLIEPGNLWKEEIEDNLSKMDVFVGLLTTAFLCSDFIEKVEIKAARKRLQKQGRKFLFVLILVDDISLDHLDLAQYQILKPGGKAVSQHASLKAGFDKAQKELEKLLLKEQKRKHEEPDLERAADILSRHFHRKGEGITIIQGDFITGNKLMKDQSINIHGDVTNSQVGQTLTNCTNMIQQQAPGERRELLEELDKEVRGLIAALPEEKQEEAAENLELVVKAATKAEPNRKWYDVSAEGLLEASKFAKDFMDNIAVTLLKLGTSLWSDFHL